MRAQNYSPSLSLPGVPVQRNYRTNAAGSLISEQPVPTNGVKLTVNMSENWADENYDFSVWDGTYPSIPPMPKH